MATTDWDARYVNGDTPWDEGAPIPLLTGALAAGLLGEPGTALVPGGGRGHDASALAAAGWRTTVVDISPTAAAYATEHYPEVGYAVDDALAPDAVLGHTGGPVDLLWDHTFFCALPPEWRPRVGALAAGVVKPGGLLASGVFPLGRPLAEGGPPFGYSPADMDAVLDGFDRVHTGDPVHLASSFPYHHQLVIWRRR